MIRIEFTPWHRFYARKVPGAIERWLREVGEASERIWKSSMGQGSPGNYSAPGAWPFVQSGHMKSTIAIEVTSDSMTIGSNAYRGAIPYSLYLREGTPGGQMSRRKMSDDALKEGLKGAHITRWVEWSRV